MPIRVLLLESPRPMVTALRCWLAAWPEFRACGTVAHPADLPAAVARTQADVLLVDAGAEPRLLTELLEGLPRLAGPPRLLVVGPDPEGPAARLARERGAAGYLSDRTSGEELRVALRQAAEGALLFAPAVLVPPPSQPRATSPGPAPTSLPLTERELEVFWLTGEGLEAKEIAARLGLSPRTVDVHRANIRAKLGLTGAHDLMRAALEWKHEEHLRGLLRRFCSERRPLLLVEDDEVDVLSVRRALRQLRAETRVVPAANGEEALDYLRDPTNPRPFLILLDLHLPRMSGPEFLAELRRTPELAALPVVVLTSSANPADAASAQRLGANAYLVKPEEAAGYNRLFQTLAQFWGVQGVPGAEGDADVRTGPGA